MNIKGSRRGPRKRSFAIQAHERHAFIVRPTWLSNRVARTLLPIVFLFLLIVAVSVLIVTVAWPYLIRQV